ncbi:DUF2917 domain-containing protein [Ramlibacter algicola]|uniref:DUF2917 domain-containing protein n=1 Tax=Ramlibacter algicola TaxID=2795217 RepID=A0A934Q5N4_9BURK|nr:DUF2917 domain-containing protein [Ramlibacter algicola]MBK0394724.1 DUF2917 domain-containing protein [Ramlibacter algicola]
MPTAVLQEKQQSTTRPAGSWKLGAARAMTLDPVRDGLLRVASGQLWATFDGPHPPVGVREGDLILEEGQAIFVAAGERVVIEGTLRGEDTYFLWEPLPAVQSVPIERWRAVAAPWRELQGALAATAVAAVHLVRAVLVAGVASLPRRFPGSRVPA